MTSHSSIVVVGGGAAGAWFAMSCVRAGLTEIDIVEPRAEIGRGLAYASPSDDHLLNVPALRMDMEGAPDDPSFVAWLAEHRPALGPRDYAPRHAYGSFLSGAFRAATASSDIRRHRTTATTLRRVAGGFVVGLADGRELAARTVVLALGNLPPDRLAPELTDSRVVENPWRLTPADAAGRNRILVAGTGLTALDAVVTLAAGNTAARFELCAGHPFVPPADRLIEVPWPNGETLIGRSPAAAMRALREVFRYSRDDDTWRAVIDGARLHTREIWAKWSSAERRSFWRHGARHWLHHRHRTAPATHAVIRRLKDEGRLAVSAGRMSAVRAVANTIRADVGGKARIADLLVNATGPSLRLDANPLLRDARTCGLVRPDPIGLGIDVDETCRVHGRSGYPVDGLYAIGPLTRGTFFEVTAVPHVRPQCRAVAAVLACQAPSAS